METYFHSLLRGEKQGPGPALQLAALWALSQPYGWVVRARNWLFDHGWRKSISAGVPVVSVGNLTVGGTGKTPCVAYIADFYRRHGQRVAILSRGYRAAAGVLTEPNDEAMVLAENLPDVPHLQGADRVALASIAVAAHKSQVLVLDDGFQHRQLGRDIDVLLIDATLPWGHGYLLPRGLLREPMAGLKRADIILLTRCDQVGADVVQTIRRQIRAFAPHLPVIETNHQPGQWINSRGDTLALEDLQDRPWAAFCGIGNPDAFRHTLSNPTGSEYNPTGSEYNPTGSEYNPTGSEYNPTGSEYLTRGLCAWRTYADHHEYTAGDIEDLCRWAGRLPKDCVILTTQKDLVKIRREHLHDRPLWALQIHMHIMTDAGLLEDKLLSVTACGLALTTH